MAGLGVVGVGVGVDDLGPQVGGVAERTLAAIDVLGRERVASFAVVGAAVSVDDLGPHVGDVAEGALAGIVFAW